MKNPQRILDIVPISVVSKLHLKFTNPKWRSMWFQRQIDIGGWSPPRFNVEITSTLHNTRLPQNGLLEQKILENNRMWTVTSIEVMSIRYRNEIEKSTWITDRYFHQFWKSNPRRILKVEALSSFSHSFVFQERIKW